MTAILDCLLRGWIVFLIFPLTGMPKVLICPLLTGMRIVMLGKVPSRSVPKMRANPRSEMTCTCCKRECRTTRIFSPGDRNSFCASRAKCFQADYATQPRIIIPVLDGLNRSKQKAWGWSLTQPVCIGPRRV